MSKFGLYACYYDLLYRDKEYAREARFVSEMLRGREPQARTLLELGCGTGRHALELAALDWSVSGVDLSPAMVTQAGERLGAAAVSVRSRVEFAEGDVRHVRKGRLFDSVISLFHVMSYQTADADLEAACATAAVHLRPGGLFFFDFWHGPAVQADPPVVRVKRLRDDAVEVTRIAEPEHTPELHQVVVNYDIFLRDIATGQVNEIKERHPMRYLFLPDLEARLRRHGLGMVRSCAWLDANRPLGPDSWYGCLLAQKI